MHQGHLNEDFARKSAELEKKLREYRSAAQKYHALFQQFPFGITISDENGGILETNVVAEELLGILKEEHESKSINPEDWNIIRPDGSPMPLEEWAAVVALRENRVVSKVMGVVGQDGAAAWFNVAAAPLHLKGYGVVITYHNITDKIQTEQALKDSEKRFQMFFENAPLGYQSLDENGCFIQVNQTWLQILGYAREEVIGRPFSDFLHPDWKEHFKENFPRFKAIGEILGVEFYMRKKDGAFILVSFNGKIGKDAKGDFKQTHCILQDITEQKRTQDALEKRLLALTRPMENPEDVQLQDLFSIKDLQNFQDQFSAAMQVASVITTPAGEPVTTPSNFTRLCSDLIRSTEIGRANCYKSDAILGAHHQNGPFVRPCLSGGLWDAGASITVGGKHLANWLIGQVRDETQTEEGIRAYARTIGADEEECAKAFWETPSMKVEAFQRIADLLYTFANTLSDMAFQNLQQARFIAERKQAEEAIKRHQSLHSKLVANIGDVIVIIDQEGVNRYKSANIEKHFGWKPEDVVGKSTWDNVHPEDIEEAKEFFLNLAREPDKTGVLECRYRRKGGAFRWIEFTGVSLFHDPDINGILGNYHDITERKEAEKSLRESEARFKALHNASFGGIAIHDKGVILDCNKGLSDISGYSAEELIGMDGLLLIAEQSRDLVMGNILAGHEKPYEAMGVRKNGEEFPLRLEARNIPYQGKQVRVVEFRDITESKQVEAEREKLQSQLLQAQKMESVGRLAGGVAHDFNNMLSVIIGHAEMAMDGMDPANPVFADLSEIFSAAQRSADITRQLLAFARKQTIAPKVLDLNHTVEGMLKMLRRLIGEDIDLVWAPHNNLWAVNMDPTQIDQILANLCVNARDAIDGVGKIVIETSKVSITDSPDKDSEARPGDYVVLAISDDGKGMDFQTQEKLFEPFFSTKDVDKGTGLGLAMVYGIVKQNKGFITVQSEVGQGATFKIHLPKHTAPVARAPKKSAEAPAAKGHEMILVVEDEPAILNMARLMLEQLGYKILAANSPSQAIQLAKDPPGEIRLVITDVIMPNMNGRELEERLRMMHPNIKTLFMSGYTANVIAQHGVLDKEIRFLKKPFTKKILAARVREALDGSD